MIVRGEFLEAKAHLEDTLTLIQSCSDAPSVPWQSRPERDAQRLWASWAMAHVGLGATKCLLGYLDQAHAYLSAVVERAPPMGYAAAQVEVSTIAVRVRFHFTDAAELAPSVERLGKLTGEFGLGPVDNKWVPLGPEP